MKKKALCIVLSDKVAGERLAIVDDIAMSEFKTRDFKKTIETLSDKAFDLKGKKTILVIDKAPAAPTKASARNLPDVKMITVALMSSSQRRVLALSDSTSRSKKYSDSITRKKPVAYGLFS
jgi:ribosomal protein L4